MRSVQLVRLDPATENKLEKDPAYMEALAQDDWPEVAKVVHRLVGRTLTVLPVSVDELHWDGYLVVDEDSREVVGSCAFKTAPTDDGTVEIAYFTYPEFEGRGYATGWRRSSSNWRAIRPRSGEWSPTPYRRRTHRHVCWRKWE